jgi:hypothetical protein
LPDLVKVTVKREPQCARLSEIKAALAGAGIRRNSCDVLPPADDPAQGAGEHQFHFEDRYRSRAEAISRA